MADDGWMIDQDLSGTCGISCRVVQKLQGCSTNADGTAHSSERLTAFLLGLKVVNLMPPLESPMDFEEHTDKGQLMR